MTVHTLIVSGIFVYFAIGAMLAGAAATFNHGFTGRVGWEVPALFFLWPFAFLLRIPGMIFFAPALIVAGAIAWFAHWVLS